MQKIGITCYPTIAGSGIIATELGKMLADKGYEIHFISSNMPVRLDCANQNIYYHEVEITDYPVFQYPPYDLSLAAKMAEVIDREQLDILHVHYAMPHAISAILAKQIAENDVKIVTTLHGTDITVLGYDKVFKRMIAFGIEKSDAVTAVSQSLVNRTKELLQVKKDINVIYNFVNEAEYFKKEDSGLREKYHVQPDEKVIIHISNFRKVKRIDDVIKTFVKINEQIKSKMFFVGDGPELSTAIDLVTSYGLNDEVIFLGKQKSISELLSISDIKLLMSEQESFGLVLLEAMACQVATIGTNVGGIPEVIEHGETGYIVELGDVQEAANLAVKALNDKNLLEKLSQNAYHRAKVFFHSQVIVNEYIQLYENVLGKN